MQPRRIASRSAIILLLLGLVLAISWVLAAAQTATPGTEEKPAAFAYAAPALIKELDTKYSFPPPVPPAPRYGGVLHVPTGVLRALDPTTVGYGTEVALVYDTLTEWETTWYFPEAQTTPIIRKTLAESWEMVDASTWDFRLRHGVKFHNLPPVNGREMTAEDVKYSYDLLKDKPGYANRAILIKEVEVRDPYTVRFHLKSPDPNYHLNSVNSFSPVIVPREAVEAPGGLAKHPVGTGAFMLKEFSPGEGALLVKNPDYYLRDKDGRQLPYLDAIRLIFTRDPASEAALFRTRQADMMRPPTLDMLYELMKTVPDLWLYRVPSLGWGDYQLTLKLDKAPYNDVRVRRALSMAINRDVVSEVINRGDAALYGPFPWVMAGYTRREEYTHENLGPYYQYNPQKARELLAEAGYPNGFDMTIEWAEWRGYVWGEYVQLLTRFFQEIGVRVKVRQMEGAAWWTLRLGGQPFTDALVGWSPPGSGPGFMDWVYLPYHSTSPKTINIGGVNDPRLDGMLDQWRSLPAEQRPAMQRQIWDYLRDQIYRITTIVPPHYRITQSYLHAPGSPYCWFVGFCSYEGKTSWMTEKAPSRKFDKYVQ